MTITVNKVNNKYKTKNNKTAGKPVFLAIKIQPKANTSSISNLRLIATRLCIVWLEGSFVWPLKKIINVRIAMIVKPAETTVISPNFRPAGIYFVIKNPAIIMRISKNKRDNRGFFRFFTKTLFSDEVFYCQVYRCKYTKQ